MAKKVSAKQGKDFFDTRSGRVLADLNFAERSSVNAKTEIGFIREAFPFRSKDDITLVLQSCDYDVEAAIACFTNGEADNLLKEWNTQGKKSKYKGCVSYMNFVMGLAHHRVSVAQWLSIRAQNPKFWGSIPPSWGLRIFSSSHACDKT
ncbi:hypothetical protein pdam_00020357 [Pocillopora damicornis]|uniref:CUE domain-containing protein n=1 Tax=Pocillopora damicornis TaxID=46731 RepID=A0A3M6UHC7_POCDA|nr:hypothetical protein pdam_00020357 [Pocillopora damicornis]